MNKLFFILAIICLMLTIWFYGYGVVSIWSDALSLKLMFVTFWPAWVANFFMYVFVKMSSD